MSNREKVLNSIPDIEGISTQTTEENIKKLISYICNLSSIIHADLEKVKNLLFSPKNLNILKLFVSHPSNDIICLTKNEEDNPNLSNEYILEEEPTFKEFKNSTIIFLKKTIKIDFISQERFEKDIEILNFNGESDESILEYIGNSMQSTFIPFFSSFNKHQNNKDVNNKIDGKLEIDPFDKIEEFYKNNGKYPTVDEIMNLFDENAFNIEKINKWKNDVISYIKLENDLDKDDSIDEIKLYKESKSICHSIMEQSDSPLIKITLELAKNSKKTNAITNIEDEIKFKL